MSAKADRHEPPAHLGRETREWWRSVVTQYDLEPHHVRLLTLAAESWDRADQARRILLKDGVVFRDRFGKPRKHPAVSIEEAARLQFARLLRELDLQGEPHPGYRRP